MKTVLITGANENFHWIRMSRKDADLSKPDDVEAFVRSQDFDICFHTAANATTAVCQDQPELAQSINVESTKRIVDVCKEKGARLIFCGTEQEYNGKENHGPFKEEEPTQSVTVYGQNKIECEKYIQENLDDAISLRFSWIFQNRNDRAGQFAFFFAVHHNSVFIIDQAFIPVFNLLMLRVSPGSVLLRHRQFCSRQYRRSAPADRY